MKPELVQVTTPDGFSLPGILCKPKGKKRARLAKASPRRARLAKASPRRAAVVYLHGNGSSSVFYKDDRRIELTDTFARQGIALLMFNNRGAHIIKSLHQRKSGRDVRVWGGMAYEVIRDCVPDIDGALALLRRRGYDKIYLAGESTGANKICVYHHYKPRNRVSGYILLSGGDDTGIYYDMLGKKRFHALLKIARTKVKQRRGGELMTEAFPELLFCYRSFYDIANPDGDYNVFPFLEEMQGLQLGKRPHFQYFGHITKPTLVVYGGEDEYSWGNVPGVVAMLKERQPLFDYHTVTGADHTFSQHQREVASIMSRWLAKRLQQ